MDKPANLTFSEEATFSFLRGEILISFVIIATGFVAALATSHYPFTGLGLPFAVMSAAWLGWVGVFVLIAWGHRTREKILINRMFGGEIWECWQFSRSEWQAVVEAESNLISPKDEGPEVYMGAVYSSIFGIVIALIMVIITILVVDDPQTKIALRFGAVAVFLLFLGVGLFQPLVARSKAEHYRRKALSIAEPRVWYASDGIYHETLGHTSLNELHKVTDQTGSRTVILFTLAVSTQTSTDLVSIPFPVPLGCEERAGRLVRCYRQERLDK
jgi:hypothetical protein